MHWRTLGAMALFLTAPLAAQPVPASPPSAERVRAAERAIDALEVGRSERDPAYAGEIADHAAVLLARPDLEERRRVALQRLLALALAAAGRHAEAEAAADALIALQPGVAAYHATALYVAALGNRPERFAVLVERAADVLSDPQQRASLIEFLEPEDVNLQLYQLRAPERRDVRFRAARALLRLGWPGAHDAVTRGDSLRMIVLERQIEQGERTEAARLAGELSSLGSILTLVTGRKYDAVVQGDRVARVRAALAAEDRATAARLATAPDDVDAIVRRAGFLGSVGRDADVLRLLMPLMADPALVVARGQRGLWLVNEAAFSLLATGEANEAIELMRPLSTMDLAERPMLINTSINFVSLLYDAGRNEEALREAERLAAGADDFASDYGMMIIWGTASCAAHALGRAEESARWLRLMEPKVEENRANMIQTLLCRGEADAAERVLLGAFESPNWRGSAILWMQDWEPTAGPAAAQRIRAAFAALRARPAVQAAFARVGHRLRLPLGSRTYGF